MYTKEHWPAILDLLHESYAGIPIVISEYGTGVSLAHHEIPPLMPDPGIIPDEWLLYTLQIPQPGTFPINARGASEIGGGLLRLTLDPDTTNQSLAAVTLGNTCGWQNWITVSAGEITLFAGSHLLRVATDTGTFNLNYIDISTLAGTSNCSTY